MSEGHVEEDFSSDDKRQKRAAREMAKMHRMINEQLGRMDSGWGAPGGDERTTGLPR